jgi:hypothetical protein
VKGALAQPHYHATRIERIRFYAGPNRITHQRLYGHCFGAAGLGTTSECPEKRYVQFRRRAAGRLSQGGERLAVRRGRGNILMLRCASYVSDRMRGPADAQ